MFQHGMLSAAIINKGQYFVKCCAVSCQVLTLCQTTFQTVHVPGIALLSCAKVSTAHTSSLVFCGPCAAWGGFRRKRATSTACGLSMRRAPSSLTDHGRLRCLLVLKARQPARTATSAPQGGHTSRCGPSLAQARHVPTLSSLHLTHTCLACAHLVLVCPVQLGPHIARLKERTDEHSGKRACLNLASGDWTPDTEVPPARPGLRGTNLSDYSLHACPGGPAYSTTTGATCSCTAAGLSCNCPYKVATHLASRVLLHNWVHVLVCRSNGVRASPLTEPATACTPGHVHAPDLLHAAGSCLDFLEAVLTGRPMEQSDSVLRLDVVAPSAYAAHPF